MIEDMGKIEYMFTVSQNVFIPAPHIDSAILKITINKEANLDLYKVLNSAFKQRRKTIYNNLKQEYQKDRMLEAKSVKAEECHRQRR